MNRLHTLTIFAAFALVVLACSAVNAQKGGSGSTGGGTIYFNAASGFSAMNSDGSAKIALPVAQWSEPSRVLHGGHRWFLQVQDVPTEGTYPLSHSVYNTRRELFAVRDDGGSLQLTNQLDLEANSETLASARWMPGDAQISWIARRWGVSEVIAGGVYTANVVYDVAGNIIGLSAQPSAPSISLSLVPWSGTGGYWDGGDNAPDIRSHDWDPNGTQVVYDRFSQRELHIASYSSNRLLLAGNGVVAPVWSPDNTLIAFGSSGGIDTISPAGTGLKNIVKNGARNSVYYPQWSPTGSNLVYQWQDHSRGFPYPTDIYRATATGGSATNLTGDISGYVFPIGWR
jgi:hypothetical protein